MYDLSLLYKLKSLSSLKKVDTLMVSNNIVKIKIPDPLSRGRTKSYLISPHIIYQLRLDKKEAELFMFGVTGNPVSKEGKTFITPLDRRWIVYAQPNFRDKDRKLMVSEDTYMKWSNILKNIRNAAKSQTLSQFKRRLHLKSFSNGDVLQLKLKKIDGYIYTLRVDDPNPNLRS